MAARYLATIRVPASQLENLLSLTDRTPARYVPQLQEVVAWLASRDDALFERVTAREPEILLAADLPSEDGLTRRRIVDAILMRTQAGELSYDRRRDLAAHFNRLNHRELGVQLAEALRNKAFSDATRETALTLAERCEVRDVAQEAADIALDPTESLALRVDAGYAVCRLGVPEACARLKPLAFLSPGDDPSDQLRGVALRAAWPASMTASELFAGLRPPLRATFGGAYSDFFRSQTVVAQLAVTDLPVALAWAAQQQPDLEYWRPLTRVSGEIATRVLREGDPTLLRQLASIVYRSYHNFHCPFFAEPDVETFGTSNDKAAVNKLLDEHEDSRRVLIAEIVLATPPYDRLHLLAHSDCPLVREADFVWLLERSCASTGAEAIAWADLARRVFNWANERHFDAWLEMSARCPAVASALNFPRIIDIESEEGRRLKAEHLEEQRRRQQQAAGRIEPAIQAGRIATLLDDALAGRPDLFPELVDELQRDVDSGRPDRECDLREAHGWLATQPDTRVRIVDAAEQYWLAGTSPNSAPLDTLQSWLLADEAPSIAALLLLHERPSALTGSPADVLRRRAPHVLVRLIGLFQASPEDKNAIVEVLNTGAPDECRATLLSILDDPKGADNVHSLVALWEDRLDEALAGEVFARVERGIVSFPPLVAWLIRKNYIPAIRFVEAALGQPEGDQALACAIAGARYRPEMFWSRIWGLIEGSQAWGRQFFDQFLASGDEGRTLVSLLSAQDAGRLLNWVLTAFPVDHDSVSEDGIVGPRDHVRFFRNALLDRLRQEGSREACEALRVVRDVHPEYPWLNEVLLHAQSAERQTAWSPPTAAVLHRLLTDRRARFITSTTQLLDVLSESLDRYAQSLHGELPARSTLWNQLPGGRNRPKDEEHLSDAVARHLRTDLVDRGTIVNREVQIRRREVAPVAGGQPGQLTDIRVDVVRPAERGEPTVLTAIVEVKGCWHSEVRSAMETQLRDRYLRENDCQTGLYLVGWYLCNGWDDADARKSQVPWPTMEAARAELVTQADSLTTPERRPEIRAYVLDCALR